MPITKNVPIELANQRLDKAASEIFKDFSRTQIKKWVQEGRILVNGDLVNQEKQCMKMMRLSLTLSKKKKSHGSHKK